MAFCSAAFLLLFLPLVMLGAQFARGRIRKGLLLCASILFYGLGQPKALPLLLLFSLWIHLGAWLVEKHPGSRLLYGGLLLGALCPLLVLKYAPLAGWHGGWTLPAGISFYTFQGVSYLADVRRGKTARMRKWTELALYLSFFPQLVAGPILRTEDFVSQMRSMTPPDGATQRAGMMRFLRGLGKKLLLADALAAFGGADGTLLGSWLAVLCFAWQLYFDFSGYSDMAVGMGRMLGIALPENFRQPYRADSPSDFWRRWHITLSQWFRDYVYIPLGGSRCGLARTVVNLLVTWALTGLWHGAGWQYLAWGVYWFAILTAEKLAGGFMKKSPPFLRRTATFVLTLIGWAVFMSPSLTGVGTMLRGMAGLQGVWSPLSLAWGLSFLPVLGVCFLCHHLEDKALLHGWQETAAAVACALLCLCALAGQSYHPFLYFQF